MRHDRACAHVDLAVLLHMVAKLHPPGPPDAALIDALERLVGARAMALEHAAPASTSAPKASGAPVVPLRMVDAVAQPAVKLRPAAPARTPDPEPSEPAWHNQSGLSRESVMEQIVERAGLASPRRSDEVGAYAGARAVSEAPGPAAPIESLFPPHRARAILRELSTLPAPDRTPDMGAAVARIARALPMGTLPRRMVSVLGHEVHMLFDAGPGMLPFTRDKQQLASTALRVLGGDRVRVADFLGAPTRGVRKQRQVRWDSMRWPGRRSALIVISDLGIGDCAGGAAPPSDAWVEFLDEAARRDIRTSVLIPYARERWPAVAARFGTALTWDLSAGVQSLRRAMRMGA